MIYMDNHSTTRVDPRVLAVMLPWFNESYANAGSITHEMGRAARQAVADARAQMAACLGVSDEELVFTSGATESNNLALRGIAERELERSGKRHIVSVVTEHRAVIDPLRRLSQRGVEVTWLPVRPQGMPDAGRIDLDQLIDVLREDTLLVSVMLANNEIGVVQPFAEIAQLCQSRGVLFHCDATQAVGKIPLDLHTVPVDLLSFSAHKMYGPKGVGALFVRQKRPRLRLQPLLDGGGQEFGLRSGTLNVPGIVGFCHALQIAVADRPAEELRIRQLRDDLWQRLRQQHGDWMTLNGPALSNPEWRLAGNLNLCFRGILGETLMLHMPELAVSSGSACTATDAAPSHVLLALGLNEDSVRSSLRIGLGRFNTPEEVELAVASIGSAVKQVMAQQ
ncbi:MAG: cysteine desulfurase family protein [Planctomycetota bacterium]|nr:cysteine desulfurase family protein [Planctomycetota bacterium]MDA1179759.1 cysteine desulfurase family protein [Planctomycetota bacterium]